MTEPVFDLEITRVIRPNDLSWVEGEDAADDTGLGNNRDYRDLRATTWAEVDEAIQIERDCLDRAAAGALRSLEPQEIQDLEIGVAGAALALAAAGCVPFTSCNGGALGGHHPEVYPLVAFYLPEPAIGAVLAAAEAARVGLFQDPLLGTVHVFVRRLSDMHAFAVALNMQRQRSLAQARSQEPSRARAVRPQ